MNWAAAMVVEEEEEEAKDEEGKENIDDCRRVYVPCLSNHNRWRREREGWE